MSRVFYFDGHQMKVFHWNRKHFTGAYSFENNEQGIAGFNDYLATAENIPTRLLIDVIEEDFRQEVIPHVYGEDRKAVISRLIDRHYRSSQQYTYSEILARQKTGRRDDKILIGGLTNPYLLQTWIAVIQENEVPLAGIWTLPIVSKSIINTLGIKKGPVLLISQQNKNNIRQTFFIDGKMYTSRQTILAQGSRQPGEIGSTIAPEIERTIEFLRNQRLIEMDEMVQIHIIANRNQVDSYNEAVKSSSLTAVNIHKLEDIQKKLGLNDLENEYCDGLFSWICMDQLQIKGHYGDIKNYGRYYYTVASTALYALSIAIVLLALITTEANISRTVQYAKSKELLNAQAEEYQNIYKKEFEQLEPVFTHARSMNSAVELADRIRRNSRVSPLDFMIELSKVFSQPEIEGVKVIQIDWSLEQVDNKKGVEVVSSLQPDLTSESDIRHIGILKGYIDVSKENYRGSVDRLNLVINELLKHERILKVEAIDMPVEVRSEKGFADESGIARKSSLSSQNGMFSLRITMKGPSRA